MNISEKMKEFDVGFHKIDDSMLPLVTYMSLRHKFKSFLRSALEEQAEAYKKELDKVCDTLSYSVEKLQHERETHENELIEARISVLISIRRGDLKDDDESLEEYIAQLKELIILKE